MSQSNVEVPKRAALRQAAAIPYRHHRGKLQLCVITSSRQRNWIFPKGVIDQGETAEQTALKETFEEAGLHGEIIGALGSYEYTKCKSLRKVTVFLLRATAVEDNWPEAGFRQRRWVSPSKAIAFLHRPELKELAQAAAQQVED